MKEAARVALARIKVTDELRPPASPALEEWTVANVSDVYPTDPHRSANSESAKVTADHVVLRPRRQR